MPTPNAHEWRALDLRRLRASHDLVTAKGQSFADGFYEALWRDYPASKSLFLQTEMATQKQELMEGLKAVVTGLSQIERLGDVLANMGIRHRSYGVLPEHYAWVADAWGKALKTSLGEAWNHRTQSDWERVITYVTGAMQAGASSLDQSTRVHLAATSEVRI